MKEMSCSALFIQPFLRALALHPETAAAARDSIREFNRESRVPLSLGYASVRHWVKSTGDEDLGLRAGATMHVGSGGALDFAMHSAPSVREAVLIAIAYHRLISDALEPAIYVDDEHAFIALTNQVEWPRAIADFTMSAWYFGHIQALLPSTAGLEVWFAHEQPADISAYVRLFGSALLRFSADRYGFRFPCELADATLETSDPLLHALHCKYLEVAHAALPQPGTTTTRVRALLASELRRGHRSAESVASTLRMSRRTLVRRLESEGTSFSQQRDEIRCHLAMRLIATSGLPLQEISDLLGFSHVQGFHRAFKRWAGETPQRYRAAAHLSKSPSLPAELQIRAELGPVLSLDLIRATTVASARAGSRG
jgi:AraC-like DNA-binding protein